MANKTLPKTQTRVIEHTNEQINRQIRRQMEARIYYFAEHDDGIDQRLDELEHEWDMERTLEANAAAVSLIGLTLATRHHKWLLLPFGVASFLFQHAVQGWCPPVEVFRRMGVRTVREIQHERLALRALRGDFDDINIAGTDESRQRAQKALAIADSR